MGTNHGYEPRVQTTGTTQRVQTTGHKPDVVGVLRVIDDELADGVEEVVQHECPYEEVPDENLAHLSVE